MAVGLQVVMDVPQQQVEVRERLAALVVDDSPEDVELIVRELERGGFEVDHLRVDTREALEAALVDRPWDIALCDYAMGALQADESLQLLTESVEDLPVICLSGLMGEEVAVSVMRSGARDFLSKDKLQRLCSTVRRELVDREARQRFREERRAAEMYQMQARRLESLGQIAAGIAHEINTPVQFIGDNASFLERLLERLGPLFDTAVEVAQCESFEAVPEATWRILFEAARGGRAERIKGDMPDALEQIRAGTRRIAKIVQTMSRVSHPDSGEMAEATLDEVIESAVVMTKSQWRYVAELSVEIDERLGPVWCCAQSITQVLINLIVNATHAVDEARGDQGLGRISIEARPLDWGCELRVSDTGIGIPEEIRSKIFDPFFTSKPVGKGTGQGLALTYAVIVKQHAGTIELESERGKGSTFIVRLPNRQRQVQLSSAPTGMAV